MKTTNNKTNKTPIPFTAAVVAINIGDLLAGDKFIADWLDERPADFWEKGLPGEGVILKLNGKTFKITVEEE